MSNRGSQTIHIGNTRQKTPPQAVHGEYVEMLGEAFYKIANFDLLEPFFMSIVSSSDHWLFISSSGGLSAGRVSAEQALFPYYTEDKLTENTENTGGKTILLVRRGNRTRLWEPFSIRQQGQYQVERNLYKNITGTALIFEEINHSLGLTYRYAWWTGDRFGFIKTGWLRNTEGSICNIELLDGLQNILPANVASATQTTLSVLLDGYKRSELDPETGLAIYALNSTLTDLAEPSESLLATTTFQVGLERADYLLSSMQLDKFRTGGCVETETETRGRRGAYFVHARLELAPNEERSWHVVADVSQDHAAIVRTSHRLKDDASALFREIEQDIESNTARMRQIVASADGLQMSANSLCTANHFANVMFNVMRGGIFADQYWVDKAGLIEYVTTHQRDLLHENAAFFAALPPRLHIAELQTRANAGGSPDLIRLCHTYLPLTFSRRHGDPSRPWNRFTIKLKEADGSQRLDYEGNWRDIFQNWEALAYSYPEFVEGMIATFLCATTVDGYNPYRITRAGVDWEIPEPGNPWANIGYWSDHQIIYLQKLMEISARLHPGKLEEFLTRPIFSYADVPYRIKLYEDLLKDPFNTIDFDWELESRIVTRVNERGTDGKLACDPNGKTLQVSLAEKLLTLLLAKLVNFVPEGGIWMNTQRPEWNDANNALVGKGLSVVTLGYLRRYLAFCKELFETSKPEAFSISKEVRGFYLRVSEILRRFQSHLQSAWDDGQRRSMMDSLGQAGNDYRWSFYEHGFSGETAVVQVHEIVDFLELAQTYIEHSLRANKRSDNLYHAYNILHLDEGRASISHLYEMLEGQVAILSSGMLTGDESLALLRSLRDSALYRADQHSYILYPDKTLPGFLQKNSLNVEQVNDLRLPAALVEAEDKTLLVQDIEGGYHFSGSLRNSKDVHRALEALKQQPQFAELVAAEGEKIAALFEMVFQHREFTGRSGTFFAYEGLDSVYWHMVAKLLLAAQETAPRPPVRTLRPRLDRKVPRHPRGAGLPQNPGSLWRVPHRPLLAHAQSARARASPA
ncbi:MAG: hypothetical protein HND47_13050 [Chloroflexi bacterium]|nr:hypothetical protein [Chloroflexota bacterium]